MDALQVFGLTSLTAGLLFYAFEERFRWAVLGFAIACAMGAVYGFLIPDAWPFGIVEAAWALVALKRWAGWRVRTAGPLGGADAENHKSRQCGPANSPPGWEVDRI